MLQILTYIAQIAGGLIILVAAAAYLVHRRQLNFNMIMNCNQRFQEIFVDLEDDNPQGQHAKRRYVDLCNEQLFYFKNGYLPREVFEEWLESMIDYLPLFDSVTGRMRPDYPGVVDPGLLEGYPTIKRIFVLDGPYDLTLRDQRIAFVRRLGKKVKPEPILLVIWRDILDHFSDPNRGKRADTPTIGA